VPLAQTPRQTSDDEHDFPPELGKPQNHWITFSDVGLIENYLRKEWCALVHFRVEESELIALFQYRRSTETDPSISIPLVPNGGRSANRCDISDPGEKHIVFVDGVKAMESPERVIPSLVWVDVPDRIDDFLPHALYFCSKSGFAFRGRNRTVEDWELGLWTGAFPIGADKLTGKMVQSAAQVMNSIPNNAKQGWRNRVSLEDLNNWLRGVRLDIYAHGVGLRISEDAERGFELLDMFFGPLDFLSNA